MREAHFGLKQALKFVRGALISCRISPNADTRRRKFDTSLLNFILKKSSGDNMAQIQRYGGSIISSSRPLKPTGGASGSSAE